MPAREEGRQTQCGGIAAELERPVGEVGGGGVSSWGRAQRDGQFLQGTRTALGAQLMGLWVPEGAGGTTGCCPRAEGRSWLVGRGRCPRKGGQGGRNRGPLR